jgi:hypothetical protein
MGVVLFLSGFGLFIGAPVPTWAAWCFGWPKLETTEFPLGDPTDVAVDSQGRIYIAENFCHRVQRYSPVGKFERGWFVDTSGYSRCARGPVTRSR